MPITFVNAKPEYTIAWVEAVNYLQGSTTAMLFLADVLQKDINVVFNDNHDNSYHPGSNTLNWDPKSGLNILQANGMPRVQSPALGLFHELFHVKQGPLITVFDETSATAMETIVATDLKEPIRPNYLSTYKPNELIKVDHVSAHTENGVWVKIQYGIHYRGAPYDPNAPFIYSTGSSGGGGGNDSPVYDNDPMGDHEGGGGGTPGGYWVPIKNGLLAPQPDSEFYSAAIDIQQIYSKIPDSTTESYKTAIELVGDAAQIVGVPEAATSAY